MILAITQRYERIDTDKHFKESFCLNRYFKDIFEDLNVLLFPVSSTTQLEKVIDICDGLLITGRSIDINPKYYGESVIPKTNISNYYSKEDELDFLLIQSFYKASKPILGVCAGIQAINVCFGGSLYQDIPNHTSQNSVTMHSIKIESNSFLEKCYRADTLQVNSFHHQAINRVADNFRITATSEDGIIEAIEFNNIIGVQWHPEKMMDIKFFNEFIKLCMK